MATLPKRETLNMRIKPEERNLIDLAAKVSGTNRTEFIWNAAKVAAEETILDQTFINVSAGAYAEFKRLLEEPQEPVEALRRIMQKQAPWDDHES